jgi:hypothetical protein
LDFLDDEPSSARSSSAAAVSALLPDDALRTVPYPFSGAMTNPRSSCESVSSSTGLLNQAIKARYGLVIAGLWSLVRHCCDERDAGRANMSLGQSCALFLNVPNIRLALGIFCGLEDENNLVEWATVRLADQAFH